MKLRASSKESPQNVAGSNSMVSREFGPSLTEYDNWYTAGGKRVFDLVLAIVMLPILLPIIIGLSLFIYLTGGSPFFAHSRVGKNGVEFGCFKFRTMRIDAQDYLKEYLNANPDAKREWQANFKLENDPRITKWGNFLRKTSLDELPQIFNVLLGTMSFVGPRPVTRQELTEQYGSNAAIYMAGRPGITGPWQIGGRNDVSYEERVAKDKAYRQAENWREDMTIIVRTPLVILAPTGR